MQTFAILVAPEVEEDKPVAETCCTVTLTFLGSYVDSETLCSPFPLADNCRFAELVLLRRNPAAIQPLRKL